MLENAIIKDAYNSVTEDPTDDMCEKYEEFYY